MAYMSLNWAVTNNHATALPSNVLAQEYGSHILNVKLTSDTDNGNLIAANTSAAWESFDVFAEAAVTTFKGIVEQQMPNGNWIVCVTDPGDALLVYQKPLTPYESPRELTDEEAFYNKAGDIVRCYVLQKYDRFEVNAAAFASTPTAGDSITGVSSKKMTLA